MGGKRPGVATGQLVKAAPPSATTTAMAGWIFLSPVYVHYDQDKAARAGWKRGGSNFCQFRGVNVMAVPRRASKESNDHLFHNNGGWAPSPTVSQKAGVSECQRLLRFYLRVRGPEQRRAR